MSSFEPLLVSFVLLAASLTLLRSVQRRFRIGIARGNRHNTMSLQRQDEESPSALLADTLDPSTAHPQSQSPLFVTLPPEIRNTIFSLALRSYDDTSKPYQKGVSKLIALQFSKTLDSEIYQVCLAIINLVMARYRHSGTALTPHTLSSRTLGFSVPAVACM